MEPFPSLPPAADAPALFADGHLWIQELVAGAPLAFRLDETGRVVFADREGPLDDTPPSLGASVRHVREHLDRAGMRATADDPSDVALYGVGTRYEGVPYDFERLPPFLLTDAWSAARDRYLPPDAVERVAEGLGLRPVNAVEKEVQAAYFDPDDYATPDSAWYGGPAAGVVFRNKRGGLAARRNPSAFEAPDELPAEPAAAAAAVVTARRVRRATDHLERAGAAADFDAVYERVLETVAREEYARLPDGMDERAFRSAVAERVGEHLA